MKRSNRVRLRSEDVVAQLRQADEAKAIGKQRALLRVQRYAVELLNANKGDITTTLTLKNLLAAIDGYHREADAEFAAASERFARIVEDEAGIVGVPVEGGAA